MMIIEQTSNQIEVPKEFHLGRLWQKKGKIALAIKHYQTALQKLPDYLPAYQELGSLLLQHGKRQEAISIYRQAEKLEDRVKGAGINYSSRIIELLTSSKPKGRNRLVLYSDRADIYGAEQINHSLMCGLQKAGKTVTCVQPQNDNELMWARSKLGVEHIWLEKDSVYSYQPNNRKILLPRAFISPWEATKIFAAAQPDLVIFSDGCPVSNLAAKQVAIALNIPYIVIVHCVKPEWAAQFAPFTAKLAPIYEQAAATIAVSQENLDLLHELFGLPDNLGRVIYNGRSKKFFQPRSLEVRRRLRQKLNIPPNATVLFTSARLNRVKGYQYQIGAIELLQKSNIWSQLYFVWAGNGFDKVPIEATVNKLNVGERVKLLGKRDDIVELLDLADIFVLPSENEGMPLSVMEAMAKGLPVIATAVSGIPEELGDTGKLLSDPNINPQATVTELAETITAWTMDVDLRRSIGQSGRQRAKKLFQEQQMLTTYLNSIEEILAN